MSLPCKGRRVEQGETRRGCETCSVIRGLYHKSELNALFGINCYASAAVELYDVLDYCYPSIL